jgi:hypothetical protein
MDTARLEIELASAEAQLAIAEAGLDGALPRRRIARRRPSERARELTRQRHDFGGATR